MADSEVRQKFEAWVKTIIADDSLDFTQCDCAKWYHYVSPITAWAFESYKAGMRAGEIAMREKAAKTVEHFADELTPEEWLKHGLCPTAGRFDGGWSEKVVPVLAKWIRALAISGAEESKK